MLSGDGGATEVQVELIAELTRALKAAAVAHWLFGGWGVDFAVGEVTRGHSDLDLIVRREDGARFRQVVTGLGYVELPSPSGPELDARFQKQGQLLEVMFLRTGEDGGAWWGDWRWPAEALESEAGRLGEIACPIVSPAFLLECKEGFLREEDGPDEPEKHAGDVARLRLLCGG
jgi:hypothetical protein